MLLLAVVRVTKEGHLTQEGVNNHILIVDLSSSRSSQRGQAGEIERSRKKVRGTDQCDQYREGDLKNSVKMTEGGRDVITYFQLTSM